MRINCFMRPNQTFDLVNHAGLKSTGGMCQNFNIIMEFVFHRASWVVFRNADA